MAVLSLNTPLKQAVATESPTDYVQRIKEDFPIPREPRDQYSWKPTTIEVDPPQAPGVAPTLETLDLTRFDTRAPHTVEGGTVYLSGAQLMKLLPDDRLYLTYNSYDEWKGEPQKLRFHKLSPFEMPLAAHNVIVPAKIADRARVAIFEGGLTPRNSFYAFTQEAANPNHPSDVNMTYVLSHDFGIDVAVSRWKNPEWTTWDSQHSPTQIEILNSTALWHPAHDGVIVDNYDRIIRAQAGTLPQQLLLAVQQENFVGKANEHAGIRKWTPTLTANDWKKKWSELLKMNDLPSLAKVAKSASSIGRELPHEVQNHLLASASQLPAGTLDQIFSNVRVQDLQGLKKLVAAEVLKAAEKALSSNESLRNAVVLALETDSLDSALNEFVVRYVSNLGFDREQTIRLIKKYKTLGIRFDPPLPQPVIRVVEPRPEPPTPNRVAPAHSPTPSHFSPLAVAGISAAATGVTAATLGAIYYYKKHHPKPATKQKAAPGR